jgi:hypothetical protein
MVLLLSKLERREQRALNGIVHHPPQPGRVGGRGGEGEGDGMGGGMAEGVRQRE